jgi:protein-S-isoprenylcysteine O-methyltransferase Ste14
MPDLRHRQIRSLVLPVVVAGIVPFLLVMRFQPFGLNTFLPLPAVQIPFGVLLFLAGVALLAMTIRLFGQVGQGTLAPWDPPRKLVVQGIYRYVRNPMISGVLFMLLGEAVLLGSAALMAWFLLALIVNTLYFKLSEEPGLVKRFGQEYITYRAHVPMWIPRGKPWDPGDK